LDSQLRKELTLAVHQGKTNNIYIKQIAELHSLLQLGVKIDLDDLDAPTGELLLAFAEEIQHKQERDAKAQQMRSKLR
jgi:hypothetical protein